MIITHFKKKKKWKMLLKNKKAQSLGSFCQMFSYDYFCIKPSELLTFDKRSNYSSYDGKIATLLFLILSILVTENFSENMLYRKNPQSILSQIVTPDPEYINLQERVISWLLVCRTCGINRSII